MVISHVIGKRRTGVGQILASRIWSANLILPCLVLSVWIPMEEQLLVSSPLRRNIPALDRSRRWGAAAAALSARRACMLQKKRISTPLYDVDTISSGFRSEPIFWRSAGAV